MTLRNSTVSTHHSITKSHNIIHGNESIYQSILNVYQINPGFYQKIIEVLRNIVQTFELTNLKFGLYYPLTIYILYKCPLSYLVQ